MNYQWNKRYWYNSNCVKLESNLHFFLKIDPNFANSVITICLKTDVWESINNNFFLLFALLALSPSKCYSWVCSSGDGESPNIDKHGIDNRLVKHIDEKSCISVLCLPCTENDIDMWRVFSESLNRYLKCNLEKKR